MITWLMAVAVDVDWFSHSLSGLLGVGGGAGLATWFLKKYFEALEKEDRRLDRTIGEMAARINEVDYHNQMRIGGLAERTQDSLSLLHTRINDAAVDLAAIKAILERMES